jgi:hypothetical protein
VSLLVAWNVTRFKSTGWRAQRRPSAGL